MTQFYILLYITACKIYANNIKVIKLKFPLPFISSEYCNAHTIITTPNLVTNSFNNLGTGTELIKLRMVTEQHPAVLNTSPTVMFRH